MVQIYDKIGDLDEHVEHVDNHFYYYHSQWEVKCKLFAQTLIRGHNEVVQDPHG